VYCDGA
jgi:ribonuclease HI